MIIGAVSLVLTLFFFMGMLVASLFNYTIPENSRFLVTAIVAFGGAIGAGFLGGGAAVSGQLPILKGIGGQRHPVTVGASGGIAVLIILLLLGPYIVPTGPTLPDVNIPATPEVFRTKGHLIVAFGFEASQSELDPRFQLRVQISKDARFHADKYVLDTVDQIAARKFTGQIESMPSGTSLWVRVAIFEGTRIAKTSNTKEITVP
jgi:hypothetical protein